MTIAMLIVTLNGISIPLSYNIVAEKLKLYADKSLYEAFIKEDRFRNNIIVSLIVFILAVVPLIFNIYEKDGSLKEIGIAITCVSSLGLFFFIVTFFDFSKMIYDYAVNTEEIIFFKTKERIDYAIENKEDVLFNLTSEFYFDIDRLVIIIETTIDKGQVKKAEGYLKYFFKAVFEIYKILGERDFVPKEQLEQFGIELEKKLTEYKDSQKLPEKPIESFPEKIKRKEILNTPEAYLESRMLKLLSDNISNRNHGLFHFIFSLFNTLTRELGSQQNTIDKSYNLLYNVSVLSMQIFFRENSLNDYEKKWYRHEISMWFTKFLSGYCDDINKLNRVNNTIQNILFVYVDKNRCDLFETFLESLGSSMFYFKFSYNDFERAYCEKHKIPPYELHKIIKTNELDIVGMISMREFLDMDIRVNDILSSFFKKYNVHDDDIKRFIDKFKSRILDKYKIETIRILLVRVCVYSLFKGFINFINVYRTYHQPEDSDAIWVGDSYSLRSLNDVRFLLINEYEIEDSTLHFRFGHHGVSTYINKFIAYYLVYYFKYKNANTIPGVASYSEAVTIRLHLEKIKAKISPDSLNGLIRDLNSEEYYSIIDAYITNVKKHGDDLDFKEVSKSELDPELILDFKQRFVTHFETSASIRKLLQSHSLVRKVQTQSDENEIGINQLLSKKLFIKQSNTAFGGFPEDFARIIGKDESNVIKYVIAENCKRISMKWIDFLQFIKTNTDYNTIITDQVFFSEMSKEYKFTPFYALDNNGHNSLDDFSGILEARYNVFDIATEQSSEFILFDTNKLGILNQYLPPIIDQLEISSEFGFSFIDFNQDSDALSKHVNDNHKEVVLRTLVWVRIFESFKFEIATDFNGLLISVPDAPLN